MTVPLISLPRATSSDGPFVIAVEFSQSDVRSTGSHSHARGQLLGATSGLLSVGIDGQQSVVPAIHAAWVPPHCMHSIRSYGPFSGWSVYFAEDTCAALPAQPCTIRMSSLLREASRRAATWEIADLDRRQMHIADVIVDEIVAARREPLGLPLPRDVRLLRITDALASDLSDSRRLEEWASWAGITPRTLSRRFVAETGFSFAGWRQQARLLRALELLAEGRAVTVVAFELGYDNVSAFIDMFRRSLGTTPGRYFEADARPSSEGEDSDK
ncbi:helix-turn-helix transcriptional regulator [Paraburkholderia agricolaris]|uniref:Helix-turn-helix transcriptional regulator n=1 Tax=Paraburkholderia agricolaris TaxID=2152888 RepID=A0ABW9A1E8_9BURK